MANKSSDVRQKDNPSKDFKTNHPDPGMAPGPGRSAKRGRPEVPHIEDHASGEHPRAGTKVSHSGTDFGESMQGDFYTDK